MTSVEDLEKKIETISERNKKRDEKYEFRKKEDLIKAKHTTELTVPCIMIGMVFFMAGLFVGMLII
jgi:hypothetical protein